MARERWNNDIAYAMTPLKLLTWPMGIWPLQIYNVCSLIRCIFVSCCMSVPVIFTSLEFLLGCNTGKNIDSFMMITCALMAMSKTICCRIYAKNLSSTYYSALNDYLTIEEAEKRNIMRRHAFFSRTVLFSLICFAYIASAILTIIPDDENNQINITDEETIKDYPIPSRCTLGYLDLPASISKIITFFHFFIFIISCTGNHAPDALFLSIALHISGQVKILKADFINIDVTNPKISDYFNALIIRHDHLIIMASKLAKTVSFVLLLQLFINSLLLCSTGFQIILALKNNNYVMLIKAIVMISDFLSQLTAYSIIGNYLKSQMEGVGLSIYQTFWYDFPMKVKKNIIFIMMWNQIPIKLQAGNFIVIDLPTLMNIFKASVSYLSVLRVMIEG